MKGQIIRGLFASTQDSIVKMSRTPANYWGEFFLDIPVGISLIFAGLRRHDIHPAAAFLTILIGFVSFQFFRVFLSPLDFPRIAAFDGGWSPRTSRESVGLRWNSVFFADTVTAGPAGDICPADTCQQRLSADWFHRLRLCHLRVESLHHSSHPFSSSPGPTLGS